MFENLEATLFNVFFEDIQQINLKLTNLKANLNGFRANNLF